MKEIDYNWLKRIYDVHDKLERSIPIGSPTHRCTKEVLLDRYFKFLDKKTFKIEIHEENGCVEIYYAMFNKQKHTIRSEGPHDGEGYYSYGVRKYSGWNDSEFAITFLDEKLKRRHFKLHWNDILKIKYEEIPTDKYWEVVRLFINTTPEQETPGECVFFDEAQGKRYCTCDDTQFTRCEGVTCGCFKKK